ncbi:MULTISPECIES: hypothetical protein [unclassified Nocardia]|uniref:hypothetical protein n=1 Tax=unclassified Nocardia TaxID=2637762 RepID=UPI00342C455D
MRPNAIARWFSETRRTGNVTRIRDVIRLVDLWTFRWLADSRTAACIRIVTRMRDVA